MCSDVGSATLKITAFHEKHNDFESLWPRSMRKKTNSSIKKAATLFMESLVSSSEHRNKQHVPASPRACEDHEEQHWSRWFLSWNTSLRKVMEVAASFHPETLLWRQSTLFWNSQPGSECSLRLVFRPIRMLCPGWGLGEESIHVAGIHVASVAIERRRR